MVEWWFARPLGTSQTFQPSSGVLLPSFLSSFSLLSQAGFFFLLLPFDHSRLPLSGLPFSAVQCTEPVGSRSSESGDVIPGQWNLRHLLAQEIAGEQSLRHQSFPLLSPSIFFLSLSFSSLFLHCEQQAAEVEKQQNKTEEQRIFGAPILYGQPVQVRPKPLSVLLSSLSMIMIDPLCSPLPICDVLKSSFIQ